MRTLCLAVLGIGLLAAGAWGAERAEGTIRAVGTAVVQFTYETTVEAPFIGEGQTAAAATEDAKGKLAGAVGILKEVAQDGTRVTTDLQPAVAHSEAGAGGGYSAQGVLKYRLAANGAEFQAMVYMVSSVLRQHGATEVKLSEPTQAGMKPTVAEAVQQATRAAFANAQVIAREMGVTIRSYRGVSMGRPSARRGDVGWLQRLMSAATVEPGDLVPEVALPPPGPASLEVTVAVTAVY
jgi:hypothetical protein